MGRLSCGCLNVQIHIKSDLLPIDSTLLSEVKLCGASCEEFFNQELSEVALNLEGIHVEHPSLVTGHTCSVWRVHNCSNCGLYTHATRVQSPGDERVLVSRRMLSDEAAIEQLIGSEEYSQAYRIALKNDSDSSTSPLSTELVSKEVRDELKAIQDHLNSFLVAEEAAMEERIRVYQDTEREKYAQLQRKARNDKNVLMSRLLSAVYKSMSDSLSDAMVESPIGSFVDEGLVMKAFSTTPDREDIKQTESMVKEEQQEEEDVLDVVPPLPQRLGSSGSSTRRQQTGGLLTDTVNQNYHTGPALIDDVFQYDPGFQEDPNEPFSESEESVDDTDDSSLADDGIQRSSRSSSGGQAPASIYSTSLPVDVPAWMGRPTTQRFISQNTNEDEMDALPPDPANIAASIQALARSVHLQTSDLFGELPRPPMQGDRVSMRH